jgi:hypothetical protein
LLFFQPGSGQRALAAGTMPVAAGVHCTCSRPQSGQ